MEVNDAVARAVVISENQFVRDCITAALRHVSQSFRIDPLASAGISQDKEISPPSVVLLDVQTTAALDASLIDRIRRTWPAASVVLLGPAKSEDDIVSYLTLGAADYRVTEHESLEGLAKVIRDAAHGKIHYSPERVQALFARLRGGAAKIPEVLSGHVLTDRELEVLRLVDEGKSNREIAALLHISLHTVKNHVHRVLEKLQSRTRGAAVHSAYAQGWLHKSRGSSGATSNRR